MPGYVEVILFFALFFGAGAFIFIASSRQRKQWAARPAILRSLAARRGFQFVEQPGKPADLAPIRPIEKTGNIKNVELPAAVRGRSLDSDLTLFDLHTETEFRVPNRSTLLQTYETFLTIRSEVKWPHFEFAAVSQSKQGSLEGTLLSVVENLAETMMKSRGLTHVPIPDRPGYQLFVDDPASAGSLRDALVRLFDSRIGWWVGALDDSMTFCKRGSRSAAMASLIPEQELDRFVDDAVQIERALRGAVTA